MIVCFLPPFLPYPFLPSLPWFSLFFSHFHISLKKQWGTRKVPLTLKLFRLSINNYLLNIYCAPGTVLKDESMLVNYTESSLMKIIFKWMKTLFDLRIPISTSLKWNFPKIGLLWLNEVRNAKFLAYNTYL